MKCVAVMRMKMAAKKEEQSVKGLTPVPQGRSTQVIADAIGSTRGTVDKIERITRNGNPKLIEAVRNDELSINQAHEIVKADERKKDSWRMPKRSWARTLRRIGNGSSSTGDLPKKYPISMLSF